MIIVIITSSAGDKHRIASPCSTEKVGPALVGSRVLLEPPPTLPLPSVEFGLESRNPTDFGLRVSCELGGIPVLPYKIDFSSSLHGVGKEMRD